jgi:aminomethyltransferase
VDLTIAASSEASLTLKYFTVELCISTVTSANQLELIPPCRYGSPAMPLRTPFYDFHVSAGARMVEFAGWEMPLLYRGIVQEHLHTRAKASLFDISHMGRLRFGGKGATEFLERVLTRRVADQPMGASRYSLVCNDGGGVLDDVIVSRDESNWIMICNAANRLKLLDHFRAAAAGMDVTIDDQTERTAMVAVQGPAALDRVAGVLPVDVRAMKLHEFESVEVMFMNLVIFRSGYSGEAGVEIILPAKAAGMAIKMLGGKLTRPDATLQPAGIGARDTLRLEAAYPLYGHELSEEGDPLAAGLGWAVDLEKEFIGAAALKKVAKAGVSRKLVGLELEGRRIARQGTDLASGGRVIGRVTSGTLSPTLQRSIALAYVDTALAAEGTGVSVVLTGEEAAAKIVKLPFYKRPKPSAGR